VEKDKKILIGYVSEKKVSTLKAGTPRAETCSCPRQAQLYHARAVGKKVLRNPAHQGLFQRRSWWL
jgi:hypothetical protein